MEALPAVHIPRGWRVKRVRWQGTETLLKWNARCADFRGFRFPCNHGGGATPGSAAVKPASAIPGSGRNTLSRRLPRCEGSQSGAKPQGQCSTAAVRWPPRSMQGQGEGRPGLACHARGRDWTATFKIIGRSPHDSLHGLYRVLILAHGERVTSPEKRPFTRKYGHAGSLLIMVCLLVCRS